MKELTLEKKIEFCNWYLALNEWEFICIAFRDFKFGLSHSLTEEETKIQFPELFVMVMEVGLTLQDDFEFGDAWETRETTRRKFRNTKMNKLKTKLELNE